VLPARPALIPLTDYPVLADGGHSDHFFKSGSMGSIVARCGEHRWP